jgi:hypothetical protein
MHLVLSHSLYQHPNGRNGEKMRKIQLTVAQDEHNNYSHACGSAAPAVQNSDTFEPTPTSDHRKTLTQHEGNSLATRINR